MKKEDFENVFANAAEDSGVAGIMRAHSDNAELDYMMNMMYGRMYDKDIMMLKFPIEIRDTKWRSCHVIVEADGTERYFSKKTKKIIGKMGMFNKIAYYTCLGVCLAFIAVAAVALIPAIPFAVVVALLDDKVMDDDEFKN